VIEGYDVGTVWIDTDRKLLVAFVKSCAGEDGKLTPDKIAKMKLIISYFDGGKKDDMLSKVQAEAMVKVMGYFDGDDNMLNTAEKDNMMYVIEKFDIAAAWVDTDRKLLVAFIKSSVGGDGKLTKRKIERMKTVISYFDGGGEDAKLSRTQAQAMVKVLRYFDGDDDAETDNMMYMIEKFDVASAWVDTDRRLLVAFIKAFAGEDGELLGKPEIDNMKTVISCFDGGGPDDKLSKTEAEAMVTAIGKRGVNALAC